MAAIKRIVVKYDVFPYKIDDFTRFPTFKTQSENNSINVYVPTVSDLRFYTQAHNIMAWAVLYGLEKNVLQYRNNLRFTDNTICL